MASSVLSSSPMFKLSFQTFVSFTVGLPLFAFLFCIGRSLHKDYFIYTTATHCRVWNFAPSISSAIGIGSLQVCMWRFCIALHAAPRLFLAFVYFQYFKKGLKGRYRHLTLAALVMNVLENIGLLVLSFVTSREDYNTHKTGFTVFLICSTGYLVASYVILQHFWWTYRSSQEERSLSLKHRTLLIYLGALIFALYFYYRHNKYCEPGVYSLFSICEYIIVLCNMFYHFTAYFDFHDKYIMVL